MREVSQPVMPQAHARRNECHRQRADAKTVFQKIRDEVMKLAALGVSYECGGKTLEIGKGTLVQVAETGGNTSVPNCRATRWSWTVYGRGAWAGMWS